MASDDEDQTATIYTDEQDLEDDADDLIDDEEQTHQIDDEENEDVDLIDDDEDAEADADEDDEEEEAEEDDTISISSPGAGDVTVAGIPIICDTQTAATPTTVTTLQQNNNNITDSVKKPLVDDSRRLFQRLWTDEDEIELLQGFNEYITQRGFINSNHHHDTTAFYDQIKGKLQLDFNKNQLVEKLRRLKKKYRNVLSKISAGKDYVFKSPHDQATFDLSCKIWNESVSVCAVPVTAVADGGGAFDDEEMVNVDGNANVGFNLNENVNGIEIGDSGSLEKKGSRSRKRSRSTPATVKVEESYDQKQQQYGQGVGVGAGVSNVVEETVKSCLLPLFKELVNSSMNGARGLGLGIGGMNVGGFGGGSTGFQMGDMSDEKWRKQHILELEVYSKRLELMQDQIKSKLEELKSMGS